MILPTKRITENRALLTVGGRLLHLLSEPKTVSRLWSEFRSAYGEESGGVCVTFDWFVLALDLLYAFSAIEFVNSHLERAGR